jgi:DNA-binding NarL/FixJ family response regulator
MASLRILVADEHCLTRNSLKMLIESHPGWTICAEVSTGPEAVSAAKTLKPDIAILDISIPEVNGLEATKRIKIVSPDTEILVLCVQYSHQLIQEILGAGARGYILESDYGRDLVIAVETIANHEAFPTPRTTGAVDLPSTVTSADQADIEGMQHELEELMALVQSPLRQQLVGITEGKPDDPNALDFIMEELFAIAVRFSKIDDRISERAAYVCWKIFTYLAPSRYEGLTPTTMAQLMSNMAKSVPQRYTSDLQSSSFLSVDLLSHSDQIFGTNYAENLLECLIRFTHLISKTHGIPRAEEESELDQMVEVSETKQPILEDANLRAEEESEFDQMVEVSETKQPILGDANLRAEEESEFDQMVEVSETKQLILEAANLRAKQESELQRMEEALEIKQMIAAEDSVPQGSALHDYLSKLSGTLKLAIERVRAAFRTNFNVAIAIFSRISSSLRKAKHGVPQSSAIHDDLSSPSGTLKLAIERVRAAFRTIFSEAIAIFSRISSSLRKAKHGMPQSSAIHDYLSKLSGTLTLTIERVTAALHTVLREAIAIFSRISPSLQKVKRWLNAPMK